MTHHAEADLLRGRRGEDRGLISRQDSPARLWLDSVHNVVTCTQDEFGWSWSGPRAQIFITVSNSGVPQPLGSFQGSVSRTLTTGLVTTDHVFTWPRVDIPPGAYKLIGFVDEHQIREESESFLVRAGSDTSCVPELQGTISSPPPPPPPPPPSSSSTPPPESSSTRNNQPSENVSQPTSESNDSSISSTQTTTSGPESSRSLVSSNSDPSSQSFATFSTNSTTAISNSSDPSTSSIGASSSGRSNTGMIAGIVSGVVALLVIAFIAFCLVRRKRASRLASGVGSHATPYHAGAGAVEDQEPPPYQEVQTENEQGDFNPYPTPVSGLSHSTPAIVKARVGNAQVPISVVAMPSPPLRKPALVHRPEEPRIPASTTPISPLKTPLSPVTSATLIPEGAFGSVKRR